MTCRIAVVGGGISGLSAAYRIMRLGRATEVTLFERSRRLGGVIQSVRQDGVVLEGGPDSSLRRKPEFLQLVDELGLGAEVMGTNPQAQGAYIFYRGHFHDIPGGIQAGVPTRLDTLWSSELLSLGEKLRLWGDFALPGQEASSDVALGALLRQRFGNGYVDRIAAPLLAGIYAGDIDRLSTAAVAPSLLALQSRGRSFVRQSRAASQKAKKMNTPQQSAFVSLTTGMSSLVERLSRVFEGQIQVWRDAPVVSLVPCANGFELMTSQGESRFFHGVVLAVPAYEAAKLLTFINPVVRERLASIEYADLAVVGAIYEGRAFNRPLTRTGYLVPRQEGLAMTAGTWLRAKWDYPVSSDDVPIRAFFGRAGQKDLLTQSDEAILATFGRELGFIMGVTDPPRFARVFRTAQGMPQFHVGHGDIIRQLYEEISQWPGLKVIGSYFDGVGLSDCIRHANQAAAELMSTELAPLISS